MPDHFTGRRSDSIDGCANCAVTRRSMSNACLDCNSAIEPPNLHGSQRPKSKILLTKPTSAMCQHSQRSGQLLKTTASNSGSRIRQTEGHRSGAIMPRSFSTSADSVVTFHQGRHRDAVGDDRCHDGWQGQRQQGVGSMPWFMA